MSFPNDESALCKEITHSEVDRLSLVMPFMSGTSLWWTETRGIMELFARPPSLKRLQIVQFHSLGVPSQAWRSFKEWAQDAWLPQSRLHSTVDFGG